MVSARSGRPGAARRPWRRRAVGGRPQLLHLRLAQLPPMSELQPAVLNRPDRHAAQVRHRMADRVAHLPHLTVPPFAHRDAQVAGAERLHVGRPGLLAVDDDAFLKAIEIVVVGHAEDPRLVHARHAVTRMGQLRGEVAVVGQDEQPFGIVVEASDRVDVVAHAPQQIDHRRPPLGIGPRRDVAARLVQQEVEAALGELDAAAVHADVIAGGVGLRPEFANRRAVDGHASVEHQLLGGAPRGDAGLRQDFLQPLHMPRLCITKSRRSRTTWKDALFVFCCAPRCIRG